MTHIPVPKGAVAIYARSYPECTRASVAKALRDILHNGDVRGFRPPRLDQITVNHYMVPARFGGLGYCRRRRA